MDAAATSCPPVSATTRPSRWVPAPRTLACPVSCRTGATAGARLVRRCHCRAPSRNAAARCELHPTCSRPNAPSPPWNGTEWSRPARRRAPCRAGTRAPASGASSSHRRHDQSSQTRGSANVPAQATCTAPAPA
ncbi:hypothetical protein BU14_0113s0025 [Porphyra umbilicalis]|uniref:Uncharacterized protein n=1 Tax=Porphyra umbilicalis TaxID=2786 RepID=A0A1X6PBL8_PORUM|nr:hypothetical protein BU14_0113s0025 [Porphyra umbilicalis]|eukprot:OSX78281.1 hypothetical protein BU14_0113s0025 [Porphyra umbilicalis]